MLVILPLLILAVTTIPVQPQGCVLNACAVVPSYCLHEGRCIFNETVCSATCVCPDEYIGNRCQFPKPTWARNHRKSFNCDPNPCSTQLTNGSCNNGGICQLIKDSCDFKCICADGYTGLRCETEHSSSVSVDVCKNDSVSCLHGHCVSEARVNKTQPCVCDGGWSGVSCDIKITENNSAPATMAPPNGGYEVTTSPEPRFNSCSVDYIERSKSERNCNGLFFGRECVYGQCKRELEEPTDGQTWRGYSFTCECDIGAQGSYCEYTCCLDCGAHGACTVYVHPNSSIAASQLCDCKPDYQGERCETFVPGPLRIQLKENTWYLYVVGACALAFVLLVVMAVAVPYMMWKHRVILIMKIVHYFKAYEDDDEREWDAFVSYKADEADEHFVVHTLYPKLEKELGFKLCLHFRDFVPGETIANNIINAVEGSRRTILILTPRYVESEFTRFEYEKAQQEMLRRKHRIIPLVLEDISGITTGMDVTLRNIVESVTYLEWPREESDSDSSKKLDKFWKRLHLSMPKRKDLASSQPESRSVNYSSNVSPISNKPFVSLSKSSVFEGFNNKGLSGVRSDSEHRNYNRMNSYELNFGGNALSSDISGFKNIDDREEETVYNDIGEIDDTSPEEIHTLSEQQEAELRLGPGSN